MLIHLKYKIIALLVVVGFLVVPAMSGYAATVGETITFNVAENFDASARSQIQATLIKTAPNLYFYVEKNWWDLQVPAKKNEILAGLDGLSNEFDSNIYPTLTSVFGTEWKPGVDGDGRITILFESMKEGASGYFRSSDEYIKLQVPDSNEREMMYLALNYIDDAQLKTFVAHEFTHLITFNQKDRLQNVQEEVWLNEARADFSSTILGYDDVYEGSNLQRRVRDFLSSPQDSLTEWRETKYDYAVASVFMHYLTDHYSNSILATSLKSKLVGIASLNEALAKSGVKEDFAQIFTNWTIATTINNCTLDQKYCYLTNSLKNLRTNPTLNFLPLSGNSSLSVTNVIKNWSGNWQKIIGGNGDLTLEFSSLAGLNFQVPYIVFDKDNNYAVSMLKLDKQQKGQIVIEDFGTKYTSVIIIPSLQSKTSGFSGQELTYPYTFKASIGAPLPDDNTTLIEQLLAKIEELKKQIADLQGGGTNPLCVLQNNLYVGLTENAEVTCLQQFLKSQGSNIYPEGLVTGNFFSLTKAAVIRFQQAYQIPATGFVGILTRTKINQLMEK